VKTAGPDDFARAFDEQLRADLDLYMADPKAYAREVARREAERESLSARGCGLVLGHGEFCRGAHLCDRCQRTQHLEAENARLLARGTP
jgi:hypothetical protein